jgi:hypothetical protein
MPACRICLHATELLLDFGPQPLCNRFLREASVAEVRHPLRLDQCPQCGLLQLAEPVPAEVLKPPQPMLYNEPEWHLDQLVKQIAALPGVEADANICGLTYKEASTIARLRQRGFLNALCLDVRRDLGIQDPAAGVETVQEQISSGVLSGQAARRGRYQVVIARHILEHAHDLQRFVGGLRGLLAAGGYLIFEIPDFTASVQGGNYATIWEEHVVYFTKATFPAVLQRLGLVVRELFTYPSALEDLLVGVAQAADLGRDSAAQDTDVSAELMQGQRYAAMLPAVREAWRHVLAGERAAGRQVALLGAGHLAIMFLNLLELRDVVDFVVDDDPAKSNQSLPGSRLQVYPSDALYERPVRMCLTSVAPENESKVLARHHRFLALGGRLVSIFPGTERHL